MKTISILKPTRKRLSRIAVDKELTMDRTVNMLMNTVDCRIESDEPLNARSNIHISQDTLDRLKNCRAYPTEPYNLVLSRLLDRYDELD